MRNRANERYRALISNRQRRLRLRPEAVRVLVGTVLKREKISAGEVSILLVNNASMRSLNFRYLGRDRPTDVISIPQPRGFRGGNPVPALGDVIISTEQVLRQAGEFGGDPPGEFALCLVHGILHLLGYRDSPAKERKRMAARELAILRAWRREGGTRLC